MIYINLAVSCRRNKGRLPINDLNTLTGALFGIYHGVYRTYTTNLILAGVNLVLAALIICFYDLLSALISVLTGAYCLLLAILMLLSFVLYKDVGYFTRWSFFLKSAFLLMAGILCIARPLGYIAALKYFFAVYFLILSVLCLLDYLTLALPERMGRRIELPFRIVAPLWFVSFIPARLIKRLGANAINRTLLREDAPPDLEIFIHSGADTGHIIGHVDMYFDGRVYSFGGYDEKETRVLGIMNAGGLFIADRERYITITKEKLNLTIYSFGIRLRPGQADIIRSELSAFMENTVPWDPPAAAEEKAGQEVTADDYASLIYKWAGGEFYKVTAGRYRTYFALSANCTAFVYQLMVKLKMKRIINLGTLTPGAYFSFLNTELAHPGSPVISRRIY